MINEFESVQWARNKQTQENLGYLEIGNKDFLSCLKYALACPPCSKRIAEIYTRQRPSYASQK
jgi:hypothetical protein